MQLLLPTKKYLENRHIVVTDEWLEACVDWALSHHSRESITFIQEKVYQEYLHADLTELGTSCLPPQLQDHTTTTITGYFPLQVNAVLDISEPAYAQLLKVEGVNNENSTVSAATQTTQERKAERMLMLEMTDGTTVVEGMEYRPAPNLNVNLSPGTKVLVYGTVKVRRGILFLTRQNITVLGGEVVDLLQTNDQRNVLMAALENGGIDSQEQEQQQQQYRRTFNNGTQPSRQEEPQSHSSTFNQEPRGTRSQNHDPISRAQPTSHEDEELDFFDEGNFGSEFDQDMSLENEVTQDPAIASEFNQDMTLENEVTQDPAIASEFNQDMTLESEVTQDPAVEREFARELAVENAFDDDLDDFVLDM